jgi:hypothetical protein
MEDQNIKAVTDSFKKLTDLSISAVRSTIVTSTRNLGAANKTLENMGLKTFNIPSFSQESKECCPPEQKCPPHCILAISRHAYTGEVIVVPFKVKNTCQVTKTYRIGVRELKNIDGSMAPKQPVLNKQIVTLDPGQSELVLMYVDLRNFPAGNSYTAEIVIREKNYNQNICFDLTVDGFGDAPVAEPLDEKKYRLKWQSWRSHFYCEPPLKSADN